MDQDFQRFIMAMQFQSSTHSPARFRNWHFSGQGGGGKWIGVAARPVLNQGSSSFSSPSANDRRRPSAPLGAARESLLGADRTSTARTATNTTPLLKISILLIHVAAGSWRYKSKVPFLFPLRLRFDFPSGAVQELQFHIGAYDLNLGLFKVEGSRNVTRQPKYWSSSQDLRGYKFEGHYIYISYTTSFLIVN